RPAPDVRSERLPSSPRPLSARGERVDRAARRVRAAAPANLARCRAPWSPLQRRRGGSFNPPLIAQASQLWIPGTVSAGPPPPPQPPAQRTQPVPLVPYAGVPPPAARRFRPEAYSADDGGRSARRRCSHGGVRVARSAGSALVRLRESLLPERYGRALS